jgi:malonate transporter
MLEVLAVTLPVFALVLCGFVAAGRKMLPAGAVEGLNAFVYWFALPAMLFRVAGLRPMSELFDPGLAMGIALAGLACFALAYRAARQGVLGNGQRSVQAAASLALAASHGNVGYLGTALLGQLGERYLPAVTLAIIVDNFVLIALALIILEARPGASRLGGAATALRSVVLSPLLGSILAGIAWSLTGLAMPQVLDTFTRMLAGAAGPCALFAIGAALGGRKLAIDRESGTLISIKLLVCPVFAALLLFGVLPVDPVTAAAGVVCAALPAASNSFIIAQRYDMPTASIGAALVGGTAVAVLTVSFAIWATGLR